jgi:hypothetical protein
VSFRSELLRLEWTAQERPRDTASFASGVGVFVDVGIDMDLDGNDDLELDE